MSSIYLSLSGINKIKLLDGAAFTSLTKLWIVTLNSNDCINEDFDNPARIAILQRTVTQRCGFDAVLMAVKQLETKLKALQPTQNTAGSDEPLCYKIKEEVVECKAEKDELKSEKLELKSEVAELKADIKQSRLREASVVTSEKKKCQQLINIFRQRIEILQSKWNETLLKAKRFLTNFK